MYRVLFFLLASHLTAFGLPQFKAAAQTTDRDTDHDGLSDSLEQTLLNQFTPDLRIGRDDCAVRPAEFLPGSVVPTVAAINGTLYGQVFPAKNTTGAQPLVEVHFYHLWQQDCGAHGHPLDTEHVAVLLQPSSADLAHAKWTALYWYAGAHESTVCDVSQITRASTLHATTHGATVWVSPGKHASFLNATLCQRGCGSDRCEAMSPLHPGQVINLGEAGHPMNGSKFIASTAWPLESKMLATNFPAEPLARLNELPETEIAWFRPGRHPVQGVIKDSSATEDAIAHSGNATTDALASSGDSTVDAISVAGDNTGNALSKSTRNTLHALGTSARHVRKTLGGGEPETNHETPR